MGCVQMPLHEVELKSDLVCGVVKLGVRKQLTVAGVDFILGNDLAGGIVFPVVMHNPVVKNQPDMCVQFPSVFPACAVTRAQDQKYREAIDL